MSWLSESARLTGVELADSQRRLTLRPAELSLSLESPDEAGESLVLTGVTLSEAETWARDCLGQSGGWRRPSYALPDHPLAHGARFDAVPGIQAVADWFAHAGRRLDAVARRAADPPEILCWPHHFDLAALFVEGLSPDGRPDRTIGVGLSPGDEAYPQPYWYVNHWSSSATGPPLELPALPSGHWHRKEWLGAVLLASEMLEFPRMEREDRVETFLTAALAGNRQILGT